MMRRAAHDQGQAKQRGAARLGLALAAALGLGLGLSAPLPLRAASPQAAAAPGFDAAALASALGVSHNWQGEDWLNRAGLAAAVRAEARRQGVPPDLADAVATVETNYAPYTTGSSGEIGLMQVLPQTARMLGFGGTLADLFDPPTNIRYGVTYLARAWAQSGGHLCRALMKYRAGLGEERYSPLSISYCSRALGYLHASGSALAEGPNAALPALPWQDAALAAAPADTAAAVLAFSRIAPVPVSVAARTRLISGSTMPIAGGSEGMTLVIAPRGRLPADWQMARPVTYPLTHKVTARHIDAMPIGGYAAPAP